MNPLLHRVTLTFTAIFASFQMSLAQEVGRTQAGLGVSTLGLAIEGRHRISPSFGVRGFAAFGLSDTQSQDVDGIDYEVDANLGGIGLVGDFFPGGGGFHLSAGVFLSSTELTATASDNNLDIGGTAYDASIEASAEFANKLAPLVSLGYDQRIGDRWTIGAELGGIATGGLDFTLRETTVGGNVIPTADLQAEIDELEQEATDFDILPFLTLRATYRF